MRIGIGDLMAARGMGSVATCGANPCTWTDSIPFVSASAPCTAYLACTASGGLVNATDPTQDELDLLNTMPSITNPSAIDTINAVNSVSPLTATPAPSSPASQAQLACAAAGNTWNTITGTCTPWYMPYIPWAIAGIAAVLILPSLLGGRRR